MKIIVAIQILIKLFTIGYGAGAVRTTGRFTAPAAAGKRADTCGFYPLNSRFPLFPNPAQTRDRRPLRKGERQRILSTVGAHNVRPFLYLYAVSDFVLLHRRVHLRRRDITVSRNSLVGGCGRHLQATIINKLYRRVRRPRRTVSNDWYTLSRRGAQCAPTQRKIKRFLAVPCAGSGRAAGEQCSPLRLHVCRWVTRRGERKTQIRA